MWEQVEHMKAHVKLHVSTNGWRSHFPVPPVSQGHCWLLLLVLLEHVLQDNRLAAFLVVEDVVLVGVPAELAYIRDVLLLRGRALRRSRRLLGSVMFRLGLPDCSASVSP